MNEERQALLLRFVVRELIKIGHSYQIVMSVIKENSKDFPPALDQTRLMNRLLTNLDSAISVVNSTFPPELIEQIEAEIMESYIVVPEEKDGNQGQTQDEE